MYKMGSVKRRRPSTATTPTFEADLKQICSEGQGAWQLQAFAPENVLEMLLAARGGNDNAARWLLLIENTMCTMLKQTPGMLCLLCDYEFDDGRMPTIWLILTALRDDPSRAIINGLCPSCSRQPNLETRIVDKYRDSMIPDLRVIPRPHKQSGHA
jgi:hypothetical protein